MLKTTKFLIYLALLAPVRAFADSVGSFPLQNPLKDAGIENVYQLLDWIISLLFGLIGLIATLAIIVAGYQMVVGSRAGKEKDISTAKNTLIWAISGLLVVVFAYTIVRIVLRAVTGGEI